MAAVTVLHTFEPRYRLDAHKKLCWSDWYPSRHKVVRPAIEMGHRKRQKPEFPSEGTAPLRACRP